MAAARSLVFRVRMAPRRAAPKNGAGTAKPVPASKKLDVLRDAAVAESAAPERCVDGKAAVNGAPTAVIQSSPAGTKKMLTVPDMFSKGSGGKQANPAIDGTGLRRKEPNNAAEADCNKSLGEVSILPECVLNDAACNAPESCEIIKSPNGLSAITQGENDLRWTGGDNSPSVQSARRQEQQQQGADETAQGTPEGENIFSLPEDSDLNNLSDNDTSDLDASAVDSDTPLSTIDSCKRANSRSKKQSIEGARRGSSNSEVSEHLQWDYSSTMLCPELGDGFGLQEADSRGSGNKLDQAPSMGLIYSTLKAMQIEARQEHKRAHQATRKIQAAICKNTKVCNEIVARTTALEERVVGLEGALENTEHKTTENDAKLTDILWKLEESENRQRRNNLSVLGIEENVEGVDICESVSRLCVWFLVLFMAGALLLCRRSLYGILPAGLFAPHMPF